MLGRKRVAVYAINKGAIDVRTAGCRDNYLLRATFDVLAGGLARPEQPGTLEHDIHAQFAPRQLGRVAFREDLDAITINDDVIAIDLDGARERAMRRVVTRQVGVRVRIAQIIQSDNVEVSRTTRFVNCAHNVAPDTAVAIDADLYCHLYLLR